MWPCPARSCAPPGAGPWRTLVNVLWVSGRRPPGLSRMQPAGGAAGILVWTCGARHATARARHVAKSWQPLVESNHCAAACHSLVNTIHDESRSRIIKNDARSLFLPCQFMMQRSSASHHARELPRQTSRCHLHPAESSMWKKGAVRSVERGRRLCTAICKDYCKASAKPVVQRWENVPGACTLQGAANTRGWALTDHCCAPLALQWQAVALDQANCDCLVSRCRRVRHVQQARRRWARRRHPAPAGSHTACVNSQQGQSAHRQLCTPWMHTIGEHQDCPLSGALFSLLQSCNYLLLLLFAARQLICDTPYYGAGILRQCHRSSWGLGRAAVICGMRCC